MIETAQAFGVDIGGSGIKAGRPLDFMANLDQSWIGVDVTAVFSEACGRPVVVVNDADACVRSPRR